MFLKAKKSLGQNFLNSKHVLERIIEVSNIKKEERILEIGPGTGFLTEALLNSGGNVIAIEKDSRAIELLKEKFKDFILHNRLQIIHGDIMDDSAKYFPEKPYSIISNIPYYITGAILEKFIENEYRPEKITILVQKEVAERIVAKNKKESVLSISIKAFGEPKFIAKVPRGAFTPSPKVDSAILTIENISDVLFKENNINIKDFFVIIKAGFAHKRKFAIRNLEKVIKKTTLEEIWKNQSLDPKIRPENIDLATWISIVKMNK